MPARSAVRPSAAPSGGLLSSTRWVAALVLPAMPFAVSIYAGMSMVVDAQRLVLLAIVGIAAAIFGIGPGLLAAVAATLAAAYDPTPPAHWLVHSTSDGVLLAVLGVCAVAIALAAGTAHGARTSARILNQRATIAERGENEHRETAAQHAAEVAALRTALGRRESELASVREDVTRAEQARRTLLASLPPELRAPHVIVPVPFQLFPPIFTPAPIGVPDLPGDEFPPDVAPPESSESSELPETIE